MEGRSAQRVDGSRAPAGGPNTAVMSVATLEQEAVVPVIGQRNGEADAVGLQLARYCVTGLHSSGPYCPRLLSPNATFYPVTFYGASRRYA